MNYELRTNKAFTLIELVTAIAILAMVLSFTSVVFKVCIGAHRASSANTEIMQKLRAITDQLNRDFKGLQKDGYLILHSEIQAGRREYQDSTQPFDLRADRMYYFSTGDFQSWLDTTIRSNIARVYFGHDADSLNPLPTDKPVSEWNLARDVVLLTPEISYAQFKADSTGTMTDAGTLFNPANSLIPINIDLDPNDVRRLMCQNVGQIVIEWSDGTTYPPPNNSLAWFGFLMPREVGDPNYSGIEVKDTAVSPPYYRASWTPATPAKLWPKALKFTFTLYDSKGIIKRGKTFTHIVYIGE